MTISSSVCFSEDLTKSAIRSPLSMETEFVLKLTLRQEDLRGRTNASTEFRRVLFSSIGGSIQMSDRNSLVVMACEQCFLSLLCRAKKYFALNEGSARIRLLYKDDDGDLVVIGSNEELLDAIQSRLEQANSSLFLPILVQTSVASHPPTLVKETSPNKKATGETLVGSVRHDGSVKETDLKPTLICLLCFLVMMLGVAVEPPCAHVRPPLKCQTYQGTTTASRDWPVQQNGATTVSQSPPPMSPSNFASSSGSVPLWPIITTGGSLGSDPEEIYHATWDTSAATWDTSAVFSDLLHQKNQSLMSSWRKAYTWVLKDPHRERYSKGRLRQRLGLAVFYYAANRGGSWTRSDNWLSYDVHECHWWPGGFTTSVCGEDKYHREREDWQYERLWLPNNGLEGTLPPELFKLVPTLHHVRLDRNLWLSGSLPTEIGCLSELQQLWLQHNMFHGSLPSELSSLTNLEKLSLSENDLQGSLAALGQLTSLRMLWLDHNRFSGPITGGIPSSPLVKLDLSHNHFSGGGLTASMLGSLTHLEHLVAPIALPALSSEDTLVIPTEVALLTNLRFLDLYVPPTTWLSLSKHRWERSEVSTLRNLERVRIGTERNDDEMTEFFTL